MHNTIDQLTLEPAGNKKTLPVMMNMNGKGYRKKGGIKSFVGVPPATPSHW